MLKLENIYKGYRDKQIFEEANLEAERGQIVLLMGKSGSGKTTLLDIIAGIKTYNWGRYLFDGREIDPKDDEAMSQFRSQHIGYIVQDFALIDDYTVLDNLLLPSLYHPNINKEMVVEKARVLAKTFELTDILDQRVKHISGGQKQRAALIRSLILDPQIILADEPTANLDADNFQLVMDTFVTQKERGRVVIISTHDDRIKTIADKVYKIDQYELVVQDGDRVDETV